MGGSHKGPWIPYRSPSPDPAVTAICLPSPRPSASGLSTADQGGGCSWPGVLGRPGGGAACGADHLSLMSSQSGDAQLFVGELLVPTEGEMAGRLVVKLVWGQRGLEGSFTTQ